MSDTPKYGNLIPDRGWPRVLECEQCANLKRELAEARRCLREAMTYCETRSTRGENVGSQVNENEYLRWVRAAREAGEVTNE